MKFIHNKKKVHDYIFIISKDRYRHEHIQLVANGTCINSSRMGEDIIYHISYYYTYNNTNKSLASDRLTQLDVGGLCFGGGL